jgi:SAM-dependent methyltransferase
MLDWTGERYLPWLRGVGPEIHYEHLQRYWFALPLVTGKRVIDLGCGEGYGSFLLARTAASVVGLDIDAAAIAHARGRYGYLRNNLSFIEGSMTTVPVAETERFDVAVCFEVLEHIDDHERLLAEVRRLLTPGGVLVISTPNRRVYSDKTGYRNPFHVKELYFDELEQLLRPRFREVRLFGQSVYMGAFTWSLLESAGDIGSEIVVERTPDGYQTAASERKEPRYFLAVASDDALPPDLPTEHRLLDVSNGHVEELLAVHVTPQLQKWEEERARLQSDLAEREQRARDWDAERVRLLTATRELESHLEATQREASKVSEILTARDRELDRLTKDVTRLDVELEAARRTAMERSELLEARERERLQLQTTAQRLTSDLEATRQEGARRAAAVEAQEQELGRLRADMSALASDLERERGATRNLTTSLETRAQELEALRTGQRRLELALEMKRTETKRLSRQFAGGGTSISTDAETHALMVRELKTRRELHQLRMSRSWRLTAALRWMSHAWRQIARRPRLHLEIDEPSLNGTPVFGSVDVVGWAIGPDPIARVDVFCDGEVVGSGSVGRPRPDVSLHLDDAGADRSGFVIAWNAETVTPGAHVVTVRAVDARGRTTEVGGPVQVTPPMELHVDEPSLDACGVGAIVTIRGWAAGPSPVDRIDVLCDGEQVCTGHTGHARPDIAEAHPGLCHADRSGFTVEWNTTSLADGLHTVTVRAIDTTGRSVERRGSVEVESAPSLYVDEPLENSTHSGHIRVVGWVSGPTPVVQVDLLCDGELLGVAQARLPRPDVAAAFPTFADAAHSGFEFTIDPARLRPGHRMLTLRARDALGRSTTVTRQIVVDVLDAHAPRLLGGRPVCQRFAVYVSSLGNYFFGEIRDLVCAGLGELGFTVDLRDEQSGFDAAADWHIVLAPHEFFHLGQGEALLRDALPHHLIIVNTEQPSSQWFPLASRCFSRAHSIWDINVDCSRIAMERGYRSRHLPLGYSAHYAGSHHIDCLPENVGTCFLEPEARRFSSAEASWTERPIDVLFVGHLSPRREQFFAEAASTLSRYRCYVHLSSASAPVIPGRTTHLDTATVHGLAQRSKIVLNIHHGRDRYFEWHRIVMHGIWQRALVLTESCGVGPPFEAGLDFVEAPLDQLPATIDHYLATSEGRREGAAIAEHGYRTLTEKVRLADCLRALILELHDVPTFPAPFARGNGSGHDLAPVSSQSQWHP